MSHHFVSRSFVLAACLVAVASPAWAQTARRAETRPFLHTPTSEARETAVTLDGYAQTPELAPVHFDFDRATIRPADARMLDRHAEWLKANSDVRVAIDGGADQRGTVVYNQNLSERRARAVRDYLVMRGVSADRIHQLGYGEVLPVCRPAGEACWQQNRRATFLVKTMERQKP